jgi:undecaprenyl-diphosphatase
LRLPPSGGRATGAAWSRRWTLALSALAVIVCWSRIYVGTHYLTDVLGGAATGFTAALAVTVVYWRDTALDRFITGIL